MSQACVPREKLKEYLAGWAEPQDSDLIELHLQECLDCEQTIVDLEADPETLVSMIQRAAHEQPRQVLGAPELTPERPEILNQALQESRRLVPEPEPEADAPKRQIGSGEHGEPTTRSEAILKTEIGAYQLIRPLGSGGMGAVFLARHRKLGKEVAIKLLPSNSFRSELFAARFEREVRAAGGLDHPAIVRATDAGEFQGTHYLVMEHIDGWDLSRTVRATGRFSIADACEIIRQVALGLSHAHAEGIIHRDIKPSNLMLSSSGQVKILDFGLARIGPWEDGSAELTTVGQLMGTLDYMAPEQAERADAVDYRADLYSLGATLFRLLCGRAPLAASPDLSPLAKLRLLATHQAPSLDTLRPDAPPALVLLVESLLSRDPTERPPSADHVAEQLAEFTEGNQLQELVARVEHPSQEIDASAAQSVLAQMQLSDQVSSDVPRKSNWWMGLALLPLVILAGVWITLETQKGMLVIRSDADVAVRVLQDGQEYQTLKLVPGDNTTRLYAGKYEVELAAGSDALQVDGKEYTVVRGSATVATVRWARPMEADEADEAEGLTQQSLTSSDGAPMEQPAEPLYEAKPLSEYLQMLAQERSPRGLGQAFVALRALGTSETKERITREVLQILPRIDGDLQVVYGEGNDRSTSRVDYQAFGLLAKLYPNGSYVSVLVDALNQADRDFQARLLNVGTGEVDWKLPEVMQLVDWLESNLTGRNTVHLELIAPTQQVYLLGVLSDTYPPARERLLAGMGQHITFSKRFWLRQAYGDHYQELERFRPLAKLSIPSCLDAIGEENSKAADVAQAALILQSILGEPALADEATRLSLTRELSQVLPERIQQLSLDMDAAKKLVDLDPRARWDSLSPTPNLREVARQTSRSPRGSFGGGFSSGVRLNVSRREEPKANPLCELLELAQQAELDVEEQARVILDETRADHNLLVGGLQGSRVELEWPPCERSE